LQKLGGAWGEGNYRDSCEVGLEIEEAMPGQYLKRLAVHVMQALRLTPISLFGMDGEIAWLIGIAELLLFGSERYVV
jgi:hypothetical protein